jgi:hypothetical protein
MERVIGVSPVVAMALYINIIDAGYELITCVENTID